MSSQPTYYLSVSKTMSPEEALTNCLYVNPMDAPTVPDGSYVICDNQYIFKIIRKANQPIGTVGTGALQREWCQWALNKPKIALQPIPAERIRDLTFLQEIDIELSFYSKNRTTEKLFDQQELSNAFIEFFHSLPFTPSQPLIFDYKSFLLRANVQDITLANLDLLSNQHLTSNPYNAGLLTHETAINFFKKSGSDIRLKAAKKRSNANSILQPTFKFEDMGIGGLDSEFSAIFRRAFASRIFPPDLVERLGVDHVRGILLFGPPGTGKTLIARQIGKMLNAREPKIVNGPEILNKYVGQSEENIRKLFSDAEREQKDKGNDSALHIIIFDELDAICKQRGSRGDSTGTGDQVVNQLLAKLDGVDQLHNILVIGMTNRKDLIDEALLRPGRLEVHVEISLPDEQGRQQILKIHTNTMKSNKVLANDVDLMELAALTKNFSGAEINGLIKSATSFAFNRHVKVGTFAGIDDNVSELQVGREDFISALDEVKPAFGVSEEELESCISGGIITYSKSIDELLEEANLYIKQVKESPNSQRLSIVLEGSIASGKTALAAAIALKSEFPFIKLISPNNMIGMNELQKVNYIRDIFENAYKSALSVIVIDKVERILDWVAIGPRFSNTVLQALMVLVQRNPPKNRRLLIIATTSEPRILKEMGFSQCFDAELIVPNVKSIEEVIKVMAESHLLNEQQKSEIAEGLVKLQRNNTKIQIGIATLLTMIETSSQDMNPSIRFLDLFENSMNLINSELDF